MALTVPVFTGWVAVADTATAVEAVKPEPDLETIIAKGLKSAKLRLGRGIRNTKILRKKLKSNESRMSEENFALCEYFVSCLYADTIIAEKILRGFERSPEDMSEVIAGMTFEVNKIDFISGQYVVILSNPNSHNYPLHQVLRTISTNEAERLDRPAHWYGNILPNLISSVRAATNAEIADFVAREKLKIMEKTIYIDAQGEKRFIEELITWAMREEI